MSTTTVSPVTVPRKSMAAPSTATVDDLVAELEKDLEESIKRKSPSSVSSDSASTIDTEKMITDADDAAKTLYPSLSEYDKDALIAISPTSHISENTGSLSAVVYGVSGKTPARLVIHSKDLCGGVSVYQSVVSLTPEVKQRVSTLFENIKSTWSAVLYDESLPYEDDYHSLQSEKGSLATLGKEGTSFGVYQLGYKENPEDLETKVRLVIVVRNYHASNKELLALIQTATIEQVYTSELYINCLKEGDRSRNMIASLIDAYLQGDSAFAALKKAIADSKSDSIRLDTLLKAPMIKPNHYNVIEKENGRYLYFDHTYDTRDFGAGVLLGMGPERGYVLIHSQMDALSRPVKWSHDKTAHLFPMGTRRKYQVSTRFSQERRDRVATWGTSVPNPKLTDVYEEFSINGFFYLSLGSFGYNFQTNTVNILKPVKVYVSTPSVFVTRLSLKQWLSFPLDKKKEVVFLPYEHPFVKNHFMPLYIEKGRRMGFNLGSFYAYENPSQAGFYFKREPLVRLIAASPDSQSLLNLK